MTEPPMADEQKERCETCKFWERVPEHSQKKNAGECGSCRRYPPVLNHSEVVVSAKKKNRDGLEEGPIEAAEVLRWCWTCPVVSSDDWCGEYQRKNETAPASQPERRESAG